MHNVGHIMRVGTEWLRDPARVSRYVKKRARLKEVKECSLREIGERPVALNTVVSLTSYGSRLKTVQWAIKSILDQTLRPERVVLYLDCGEEEYPKCDLEPYEELGLKVVTGVENYRSHKKYWLAFKEFPDKNIITIDDDLIYAADVIESLISAKDQFENCVLARRVHRMSFSQVGGLNQYAEWEGEYQGSPFCPSMRLLATTGAGTLFTPSVTKRLQGDPKMFMSYSPNSDDIWLKFLEVEAGIPVVYVPNDCNMPYTIPGTQESGLYVDNTVANGNDIVLNSLLSLFGFADSAFMDN